MTQQSSWMASVIPFFVIAVVMWLRFRNINKARRFRPGQMWVAPLSFGVMVAFMLHSIPPSGMGWAVLAGGAMIGAAVGWQRGRLTHMDFDPATGQFSTRQSPAALLFILAIFALRRLIVPASGAAKTAGGHLAPQALLITDGLLGFALGMIIAMRLELWLRAKRLKTADIPVQ